MLSTAFSYARYSCCMETLTGFRVKKILILLSLANNFFNSLRDENVEPICTYNDEFMRQFVRQNIKVGRCSVLYQFYKSTISDQAYNVMSQELGVNGNICQTLQKYFEFTNKHRKLIEDENDS